MACRQAKRGHLGLIDVDGELRRMQLVCHPQVDVLLPGDEVEGRQRLRNKLARVLRGLVHHGEPGI